MRYGASICWRYRSLGITFPHIESHPCGKGLYDGFDVPPVTTGTARIELVVSLSSGALLQLVTTIYCVTADARGRC